MSLIGKNVFYNEFNWKHYGSMMSLMGKVKFITCLKYRNLEVPYFDRKKENHQLYFFAYLSKLSPLFATRPVSCHGWFSLMLSPRQTDSSPQGSRSNPRSDSHGSQILSRKTSSEPIQSQIPCRLKNPMFQCSAAGPEFFQVPDFLFAKLLSWLCWFISPRTHLGWLMVDTSNWSFFLSNEQGSTTHPVRGWGIIAGHHIGEFEPPESWP